MGPTVCEVCGEHVTSGSDDVVNAVKPRIQPTFGPTASRVDEPVYFHRSCWPKRGPGYKRVTY
jgi:hypothetical protein